MGTTPQSRRIILVFDSYLSEETMARHVLGTDEIRERERDALQIRKEQQTSPENIVEELAPLPFIFRIAFFHTFSHYIFS